MSVNVNEWEAGLNDHLAETEGFLILEADAAALMLLEAAERNTKWKTGFTRSKWVSFGLGKTLSHKRGAILWGDEVPWNHKLNRKYRIRERTMAEVANG